MALSCMALRKPVFFATAIATVIATALVAMPTNAAEQRARLQVDVNVEGTESVTGNGSDKTTGEFIERYTLVTYLQASGEPMEFNTKDPQYAQKMLARAAAVQHKVQEAQGNTAPKMTPQQLAQYMQLKQAECQGEQSCLMGLAMEASQLSAAMVDGTGANGGTNGGTDNGGTDGGAAPEALPDEDSEPELRYQPYVGYDNCGAEFRFVVQRKAEGTLGDVGGPVSYTVQEAADYQGDANELRLICVQHNIVLDTKTATLYSDGATLPPVRGTRTDTLRDKTTEVVGEINTHGEAFAWAIEQLRSAPATGERSTVLQLTHNQSLAMHSGAYTGEARVKIAWRFESLPQQ